MEGASESLSIARDRAAIAKHALQENNFAPPARPDAAQRQRTVRAFFFFLFITLKPRVD